LDEPFAGLDPVLRADLRAEVKAILAHARTAALLVTHDQTEALSLASHVALMHDGIIEQSGSPLDVYFSPATLWCAEFLGEANVLNATVEAGSTGAPLSDAVATSLLGTTPMTWMETGESARELESIRLMIRPESLSLTPGRGWCVVETSFAGHDGLVTLTPTQGRDESAASTGAQDRVKVLVPAREMPQLGANYDVNVIGATLGYRALG
jgi:iron(III) transport system ATP-binding protein